MSDQELPIPNYPGWPLSPIAEVSEFVARGTAPVYVESSDVLAIGQRCVTEAGFDAGFARPHDHRRMRGVLTPRSGDVFVNSTGTGTIGRSCVYGASGRFIVDGHITVVRPRQDSADGRWLEALIRSPWGQIFLEEQCYSGSTNQVELSGGRFSRTLIPLPSVPEQRRIAEILDTADEAILSTGQLIAKLEQAKHGLLQDILTRGIDECGQLRDLDRFQRSPLGLVPEEWSIGTLNRVLTRIDAGRSPDLPDRPAQAGEWGVLKVSAIRPDGLQEAENKVVTSPSLIDSSIEVRCGDLLISRANTPALVGLACYARDPRPGLMLSDKTLRLNIDSKLAVPEFIGYTLQASSSRRQIETSGTGSSGSMKNISQDEIRTLVLALPGIEEQHRILASVESARVRLDTLRRELSKLRLLKRGLMDDLLTGRIRVGASA